MLHTGGRVATTTRKAARLRRGVPVLMYHLVSDEVPPSFDGYTVTPAQFAAQVRTLSRLGARSISPEELRVAHQEGRRLPPRSVVITFDDGFRDCLRHAAPVLHEAGFRATMYVVAGLLGKTSRWLRPEGLEHLPLISSADARELEQAGIDCQSHSFSHPRLAELGTGDITRELCLSRRVLEDELGHGGPAIELEKDALRLKYAAGDSDSIQVSHHNLAIVDPCGSQSTARPSRAPPGPHRTDPAAAVQPT